MTKMSLFGTSFVAAIPGLGLGYLMLMVILNHFDTIPMILKVVAILTFTMALMMVLFPAGILIWHGGRGKTGKDKAKAAVPVAAVAAAGVAAPLEELDEEFVDADDDFEAEDDFEEAGAMGLEDDFGGGDAFEADGGLDDEFEFDDFDEEEEKY